MRRAENQIILICFLLLLQPTGQQTVGPNIIQSPLEKLVSCGKWNSPMVIQACPQDHVHFSAIYAACTDKG